MCLRAGKALRTKNMFESFIFHEALMRLKPRSASRAASAAVLKETHDICLLVFLFWAIQKGVGTTVSKWEEEGMHIRKPSLLNIRQMSHDGCLHLSTICPKKILGFK